MKYFIAITFLTLCLSQTGCSSGVGGYAYWNYGKDIMNAVGVDRDGYEDRRYYRDNRYRRNTYRQPIGYYRPFDHKAYLDRQRAERYHRRHGRYPGWYQYRDDCAEQRSRHKGSHDNQHLKESDVIIYVD
jgi:hypothetical protein